MSRTTVQQCQEDYRRAAPQRDARAVAAAVWTARAHAADAYPPRPGDSDPDPDEVLRRVLAREGRAGR